MGNQPPEPGPPPPPHWGPPSGPPVGGPPPPATSNGPANRPDRPDPVAARDASRWLLRFSVLVLASLMSAGLPLPWQLAALAFSLAALTVGVLAVRSAVRARLRRPVIAFTAAGVAMAALLALGQAASFVLWDVHVERQECLADALSSAAERRCEQEYQRQLRETLLL